MLLSKTDLVLKKIQCNNNVGKTNIDHKHIGQEKKWLQQIWQTSLSQC